MNPIRIVLVAAIAAGTASSATGQPADRLRIGLMLPYTGTFAALGAAIENGFRLHLDENGGRLAGRTVEFFKVDDESDPSKAVDNANKLVKRDKVDVIVGSVHSGVAMALAKVARESGTLLLVPNAGADAITGPMCAPNVFRVSFSNWQPSYAMGLVAAEQQKHKTAVTIGWKYSAGDEAVKAFKEGFEAKGGQVVKELSLPFPGVEFQALLTEIAAAKPDAVFAFFAGGGAVKFVKDYAAAGLKAKIPLYGPGFLTDGTLEAQGDAAAGMLTTLHYGDDLAKPKNKQFRLAYAKTFKLQPDVYAVQGYDAAQLLAAGLAAAGGDIARRDAVIAGMEQAKVDSPRGPFTMSRAHNPVQDIYLRRVDGASNKAIGFAVRALADPARGCKL